MRTTRYVLLSTFAFFFVAASLIAFTQTAPLQFVARDDSVPSG